MNTTNQNFTIVGGTEPIEVLPRKIELAKRISECEKRLLKNKELVTHYAGLSVERFRQVFEFLDSSLLSLRVSLEMLTKIAYFRLLRCLVSRR